VSVNIASLEFKANFSVPVSFAGMVRPCPNCGKKCPIPQKPVPRKKNGCRIKMDPHLGSPE
jgi:hypothetical protein